MDDPTLEHEGITEREMSLSHQVIRLRLTNAKLLEALEGWLNIDWRKVRDSTATAEVTSMIGKTRVTVEAVKGQTRD